MNDDPHLCSQTAPGWGARWLPGWPAGAQHSAVLPSLLPAQTLMNTRASACPESRELCPKKPRRDCSQHWFPCRGPGPFPYRATSHSPWRHPHFPTCKEPALDRGKPEASPSSEVLRRPGNVMQSPPFLIQTQTRHPPKYRRVYRWQEEPSGTQAV